MLSQYSIIYTGLESLDFGVLERKWHVIIGYFMQDSVNYSAAGRCLVFVFQVRLWMNPSSLRKNKNGFDRILTV